MANQYGQVECNSAASRAFGKAKATVTGWENTLSANELRVIDRAFRASNYLAVAMMYLQSNVLLKEPLKPENIKKRLLGHWGSAPGQSFTYVHANRVIKKFELTDSIFVSGPGHGAPGVIAPVFLEGTYTEQYPDRSLDEAGIQKLCKSFSFPGGIGSHCTPELPGSIHEGGELGYSLARAAGMVLDAPQRTVFCMIGDGEAETATLATSWHVNKLLNPCKDGTLIPILHLNGYKIANPTVLSRIPQEELTKLFEGYGWEPYFVEGDDVETMHQAMAATMDKVVRRNTAIRSECVLGNYCRPRLPVIILRTPKGWTGIDTFDGHKITGSWRSHQVPCATAGASPEAFAALEAWLKSYGPEDLFDSNGRPYQDIIDQAPTGTARMGSNPVTYGVIEEKTLPEFIETPVAESVEATKVLGQWYRDFMKLNENVLLFGPDETASNKLQAVYEVTQKAWSGETCCTDVDGGCLSQDGRVYEFLSENLLVGMLEGYVITGRNAMLASYEAFCHVFTGQLIQHIKWLEHSSHVSFRKDVAPINILLSSTSSEQYHNGGSHNQPSMPHFSLDMDPRFSNLYYSLDANTLVAIAERCFASKNVVNFITSEKQSNRVWLNKDQARAAVENGYHVLENEFSSNTANADVVLVSIGAQPTQEVTESAKLLKSQFPQLKVKVVVIVDLNCLNDEHPSWIGESVYNQLFPFGVPVYVNTCTTPWVIHRLTYRRDNNHSIHVRGYKEGGSIETKFSFKCANDTDRFTFTNDVISALLRNCTITDRATAQDLMDLLCCRRYNHLRFAQENGYDNIA